MAENTMEVRDLRGQDWLWTSKALLFHSQVNPGMYKTYAGLSSYANNITQKAFPSVSTLAKKLHISRTTVMKCLADLEKMGAISTERKNGLHNIYSLLTVGPEVQQLEMMPAAEKPKAPAKPEPPKATSEFSILWDAYPNKIDKKRAEAAFKKMIQVTTFEVMMRGLQNHKESEQWIKEKGRFVPHPTTWLNNKRWEIVLPKAKPPEKKPFYKGDPMVQKNGKWYVIVKGQWLEFADKPSMIEYKILEKLT